MIKYIKVCIAWIMLAAIFYGLPGCQGDISSEPSDQNQNNESKETSEMAENAPTYIRTGNTTDFVTSKIDIDAMLARPYDNTVPVAFSEGVFAIHSYGWGFDNETLFSTGNGTGLGMPIEIFVDDIRVNYDSAIWRPSHVTANYSSTTENGKPKPTNIAPTAKVSATYTSTYDPDGLAHLIDGIINYSATPRNRWSNYVSTARLKDTLTFDFKCTSNISGVTVYLYDDGGATRLPASMQLEYYINNSWIAVPSQICGEIQKNKGVDITFPEITTDKLRLTLTSQSGKSVGVTEIEIFGYNEKANTLPQGVSIEEKKFVTSDDVATSIITLKNETGKNVTVKMIATPSIGYGETAYSGRYVLFGGKDIANGIGTKTITVASGETVEFRSALAFSNAKGQNKNKLDAIFADQNCVETHAEAFADWFEANVPYFDCDDEQILQTYYIAP